MVTFLVSTPTHWVRDPALDMNSLQYQTIEGSDLVLTDKTHNYLGPELVLKESESTCV